MKLTDLLSYQKVYIQCHDNPDADTIASGFALYRYFIDKGKEVVFFYSGKFMIQKSNLMLMIKELEIPILYVKEPPRLEDELLIMVDCQYGAGNVTKVIAEHVIVIDHHQLEMEENEFCEINSSLGSCSTLVWKLLEDDGYGVNEDTTIGTALY